MDFFQTGFIFSEDEPTALLQNDGGPCAIIVPVQAFILKNLLFTPPTKDELHGWRELNGKHNVLQFQILGSLSLGLILSI